MSNFVVDSGVVSIVCKPLKGTQRKVYTKTFTPSYTSGWGISKEISKLEYDAFNVDHARRYAELTRPMLTVCDTEDIEMSFKPLK